MRGVALDEAIGREAFPAMLLRLWRGDAASEDEAALMGACLVASIDHGPLAPSALVTRTIASTLATPMAGLAGGILAFGELHGAVVSRAMRILASAPAEGELDEWAGEVFEAERAAGRRLPGVGHRWHRHDLRVERLLEVASGVSDSNHEAAIRALAARVSRHAGHPTPVNIDGALAVALTAPKAGPGSTATSCSPSRGASGSPPTSWRNSARRAADAHHRSDGGGVRRRSAPGVRARGGS